MSDEELMDAFIDRFGLTGFMEIKELVNSNESYRSQVIILEKKLKEALDKKQEA